MKYPAGRIRACSDAIPAEQKPQLKKGVYQFQKIEDINLERIKNRKNRISEN